MVPNNYCTGIAILLMVLITSSTATEQLSSRQRGYGLVKFEGDQDQDLGQRLHGPISFQEQEYPQGNSQPFRFDDTENVREDLSESHRNPQENVGLDNPISFGQDNTLNQPEQAINVVKDGVTFQDDNVIEDQKMKKNRKKRRRRRPRLQQFPASAAYPHGYPPQGAGYPNTVSGYPAPGVGHPTPGSGYPTPGSGYPAPTFGYPISGSGYPAQGYGHPASYGQNPYGNPALGPGLYRPLRRPRPHSVATDALSTVTRALASIAHYDDYQCVPRLLCEAAGSGGAIGAGASGTGAGSGLLQSVAALQPLLTLLTAYNGISSSPLFIFGRAVFLGMTSRGAPNTPGAGAAATCRYAYPLCPTDPEQLVHYLNNHNGGFFRFFNAPQRPHPQYGLQQNLEQFYSQLAAPGPNVGQYGFYQLAQNLGPLGQQGQLGYPAPGAAQGYGLYNNDASNQQYNPNYQIPTNVNQNYGATYPYNQNNYGFAKLGFKNNENDLKSIETNKIEKRIQNVKSDDFDEEIYNSTNNVVDRNKYSTSKWLFPNTNINNEDYAHRNEQNREGNKKLSFPIEHFESDNSGSDSNRIAKGFNFPGPQSNRDTDVYAYESTAQTDNTVFPHSYPHDSQTEVPQEGSEEGLEVVYIVRGDGDPSKPEIVKLRPGQSIQSIGFL